MPSAQLRVAARLCVETTHEAENAVALVRLAQLFRRHSYDCTHQRARRGANATKHEAIKAAVKSSNTASSPGK